MGVGFKPRQNQVCIDAGLYTKLLLSAASGWRKRQLQTNMSSMWLFQSNKSNINKQGIISCLTSKRCLRDQHILITKWLKGHLSVSAKMIYHLCCILTGRLGLDKKTIRLGLEVHHVWVKITMPLNYLHCLRAVNMGRNELLDFLICILICKRSGLLDT